MGRVDELFTVQSGEIVMIAKDGEFEARAIAEAGPGREVVKYVRAEIYEKALDEVHLLKRAMRDLRKKVA
jgi:hypothetical protein